MPWISPDFPKAEKLRIIFENDEIAVRHFFFDSQKAGQIINQKFWKITREVDMVSDMKG